MATVNKDFKIKSGLIVEGTTATVNGYDVITKSQASQDYIVEIIGGETLVTSVESTQMEVVVGELNIKSGVFDVSGAAAAAQSAATSAAATDATSKVAAEAALRVSGDSASVATAAADATSKANAAQTAATSAAATDATSKANAAKSEAISAAATDATTKANAAQAAAEATSAAALSSAISTEVSGRNTAIASAVAAVVDAAPAALDTLNELAAALADSPDTVTNLTTLVGLKAPLASPALTGTPTAPTAAADTSTTQIATTAFAKAEADAAQSAAEATASADATSKVAAEAALRVSGDSASVATAAADATSKANAAQTAAQTYADALTTSDVAEGAAEYFTDARAKTSAASLLVGATKTNITITGSGSGLTITAENGVADSTTSDLAEGSNLYFTNGRAVSALQAVTPNFTAVELNSVAKQVAATSVATVAGIATAYSWPKATYKSAEFLVKVAYGAHTEISKVLLTLDTSDNISITEYAIVGTNGSASSVSAAISGSNAELKVTTANNNSTITVVGTLLA